MTTPFKKICEAVPLFVQDDLFREKPAISQCFEDTLLTWIPYGYLWIVLIPFSTYLYRVDRSIPLPLHPLQIAKKFLTVVAIVLVTVEIVLKPNGTVSSATYIAAEIKTATFVLILILEEGMRYMGVKSCIITFTFWLLVALAEVIPIYSLASNNEWSASSIASCARLGILWIQLVLRCFADQYTGIDEEHACPLENASFPSRIAYTWMFNYVLKTFKKPLKVDGLWPRTRHLESKHVVGRFLANWRKIGSEIKDERKELEKTDTRHNLLNVQDEKTPLLSESPNKHTQSDVSLLAGKPVPKNAVKPSVFLVLWRTHRWRWFEATAYKVTGDTFDLLQPFILNLIIQMVEDSSAKYPRWMGFSLSVALFIASMMKTFFWNFAQYHQQTIGLKMKVAVIGAVYRKTLKLSNSARKTATVGEIVNLMAVDSQRIQDSVTLSHHVVSIPYVTTVSMIQLWYLIGPATFSGIGMLVLVLLLNGFLGRWQTRLQNVVLGYKCQRARVLNEIINGIKILKMYTWEKPFQQKVSSLREEEVALFRRVAIILAVAFFLSFFSPFMVSYTFYLVHTLVQSAHSLDARTAFVVLALVSTIRHPVSLTSEIINGFVQGYVSLKRVQEFLWKEEIETDNVSFTNSGENAIHIQQGDFAWSKDCPRPTLTGINLDVPEGKLYAVVGQVGSGKSSLLAALLGEMEKLRGTVRVKGTIAFVPQEAWIQNLTLRDNVLFGNTWDSGRYSKVLEGCALLPDLELLAGRDLTEIGEKGINLSGGQKQRVSLARAAYSDADMFLLDDPLSAVDSHVGKHIFDNVIGPKGLLKHKTRVLVTHGVHWLSKVDKIIVIADGKITSEGTYRELLTRDTYFANLLQTLWEDDKDENQRPGRISREGDGASKARVGNFYDEKEQSFGLSFSKDDNTDENVINLEDSSYQLVQEERLEEGGVKLHVFKTYLKAMGYVPTVTALVFIALFQSLSVYSNYWLTYWTEDTMLKNFTIGHTKLYEHKYQYYLVGYTILGVLQGAAMLVFGLVISVRMAVAAGIMHESMLNSILRSPMSFFDTTPTGRIINRFSSDIDIMDIRIPYVIRWLNTQMFQLMAIVVVVSVNTPIIMAVIFPVSFCYFMLLRLYQPIARQTTRLESVTRSPVFNHFSETISGAYVIRAYKCADRFITECDRRVDRNIKFLFASLCAVKWNAICLETLGNLIILATSVFAFTTSGINGAVIGLSISYALQITLSLLRAAQLISELEMRVISIERVKEYSKLTPEAPLIIESKRPPSFWPRDGTIEFCSYKTRYRDELALTLRGISCVIESGEKIGIVGRTGAGKSSLALSLFRLVESAGGAILIDGQDISTIGLHDLRDKLTILPQDPVIFSGSLRENIDPFGKYDDGMVWNALKSAHLERTVAALPGRLDYECGEAGSNLSVGQKQLLSLARTLLHETKILILDEATSAVDLETDELIQTTIRLEFKDCTVLTIAHRLNTVLDSDRIIVLSDGQILEMDAPARLLQDHDSVFYKMAVDAGIVT